MAPVSASRARTSTPRWRFRPPSRSPTSWPGETGPSGARSRRSNRMPHAIRFAEYGSPDVLRWVEVPMPVPAKGEALIRQTAVGVNFIDVYHRTGTYQVTLPAIVGSEGAGVVEAVGPGVTEVKAGDRVAYQGLLGGYAEVRVAPATRLVRIPDGIDDKIAAAALL